MFDDFDDYIAPGDGRNSRYRRDDYRDNYNDDYRNDYHDDYRNDYRNDYRDDYRDDDYDRRDDYRQENYPRDDYRRDNYYQDDYDRDDYDREMPRRKASPRDNYREAAPREDYAPRRRSGGGGFGNFRRRHPIIINLLAAILAGLMLIWIGLWFLDFWTFHGQERAVPDVKGQSLITAESNIDRAGLRTVVTDSVYDSYARPGTVVEQVPIPSAKIKKGGAVYLTAVAFSPKMITIPDLYDVSERQARSMLEGLGITQILISKVPSEYSGLVMGAKFNGVELRPGAKVPVTAVITLEVGEGLEELSEEGAPIDSAAIEEAIEAINID